MIVIGIVGLISSGKSTVGKILEFNGCRVLNLDQMSHEVYLKGSDAYREIINAVSYTHLTLPTKRIV